MVDFFIYSSLNAETSVFSKPHIEWFFCSRSREFHGWIYWQWWGGVFGGSAENSMIKEDTLETDFFNRQFKNCSTLHHCPISKALDATKFPFILWIHFPFSTQLQHRFCIHWKRVVAPPDNNFNGKNLFYILLVFFWKIHRQNIRKEYFLIYYKIYCKKLKFHSLFWRNLKKALRDLIVFLGEEWLRLSIFCCRQTGDRCVDPCLWFVIFLLGFVWFLQFLNGIYRKLWQKIVICAK